MKPKPRTPARAWAGLLMASFAVGSTTSLGQGGASGNALVPATTADFAAVRPGATLAFPADEGSHPDYRTEWWYVTGWLATADGRPLGFQVTFFRTRPIGATANPSAFTARQLVIAHAAISDPERGRLWHDQRIARAGFGLAEAGLGKTDVHIRDWRLADRGGTFEAVVDGRDFGYALALERTQPPLVNGRGGYSRKGPDAASASWYYSLPHLRVRGTVTRAGRSQPVTGEAWLDHEWSSTFLDAQAAGWDWLGLNLDDGGALMAFRIRGRDGTVRWSAATLRDAQGATSVHSGDAVAFSPGRAWRSPRTGITYPVAWTVRAAGLDFGLEPLFDDQESDSRLTTGAVYWEGAVTATAGGRRIGRGYLELTGYGEPLELR